MGEAPMVALALAEAVQSLMPFLVGTLVFVGLVAAVAVYMALQPREGRNPPPPMPSAKKQYRSGHYD